MADLSSYSYSDLYALDRFVFDKRMEGVPYQEIIEILEAYIEMMEEFSGE